MPHRFEIVPRFGRRAVKHEDERPGPLHVTQEAQAQAGPVRGALDQTWDVRDHDSSTLRLRDLERDICPVPSRLASARAVGAGFGVPPTSALVAREVVQLVCSGEDYRAAATTVTTVWAASRHKRFASK